MRFSLTIRVNQLYAICIEDSWVYWRFIIYVTKMINNEGLHLSKVEVEYENDLNGAFKSYFSEAVYKSKMFVSSVPIWVNEIFLFLRSGSGKKENASLSSNTQRAVLNICLEYFIARLLLLTLLYAGYHVKPIN